MSYFYKYGFPIWIHKEFQSAYDEAGRFSNRNTNHICSWKMSMLFSLMNTEPIGKAVF